MKIFISLLVLFVLLSLADLILTGYIVGDNHKLEANPVAKYVISYYDFEGLIYFKVASIVMVAGSLWAIWEKERALATKLTLFACSLMGGVVVYSLILLSISS